MMEVLSKRFGKYSLSLHPTKTRLVHFGYDAVKRLWHKWLNRRSRRRGSMTWERLDILLSEHLSPARPRVVHSIYAVKS